MKPTPTATATKRFNNSLESSSMEMVGFRRRSWKSCSSASRVRPTLGSSSGYSTTSATVTLFLAGQGMIGRRNHDQFVAVDGNHGEPLVVHRHRDHAEVAGVVDDGFENFVVLQALYADCHTGVLALEVGKYLGQDVQAGALVGRDHDFAARHAMHLGQRDQHHAALLEGFFGVLLKDFAGGGDGDLAAAAIEQLGADFFLQGADLRRDRRLGAETPLRRPREAAEPRDLQKRF